MIRKQGKNGQAAVPAKESVIAVTQSIISPVAAPVEVAEFAFFEEPDAVVDLLPVVPSSLKGIANWLEWRVENHTKLPYVSGTNFGRKAASDNPATWVSYGQLTANGPIIDSTRGVGFVLNGEQSKNLVAYDIDGCRDSITGEVAEWAKRIIAALGNPYTEITPSGSGLRPWVAGTNPFPGNKLKEKFLLSKTAGFGNKVQIEIFRDGQYVTVTGNKWAPSGNDVAECGDLSSIFKLCEEIAAQYPNEFGAKKKKKREPQIYTYKGAIELPPPDPGFKALFDAVGFEPLVRRLNNHIDTRFHDMRLGVGEPNTYCPVPSHGEQNVDFNYQPCFGVIAGSPELLHCFGCDWTGDMVAACYEVDSDEKKNMYDVARAICAENNLTFEDFFPSSNSTTPNVVLEDEFVPEMLAYDMTPEEMAEQDEAEYPVRRLKASAGPHFDENILYGPIGEVARKMSKHNESHIAAIYLNLLVSLGNIFGRGPYFNINKTKHHLNEFLACVGDSATARKGQGADEVNAFLEEFAGEWVTRRNMSGFGSRQGIIYQIRDAATFQTPVREKGVVVGHKDVTKPGVDDKRLCIREDELSTLFKLAAKSEDKTDDLIREAWDGKRLSNLVAGKTETGESNSLICREPMISIVGYTTPSLAKSTLVVGADTSGFGNRFLWCHIRRLQLCAFGGPDINWGSEKLTFKGQEMSFVVYFYEMLREAVQSRLIPLAKPARRFYQSLYEKLERSHGRGFVARMTSRGSAHIRRFATILCLIDREDAVRIEHLKAAEAIWDYCVESTRYIFVGYTLEQARILRLAQTAKDATVTLTDVHNLFDRHKTADWVKAQLVGLVADGYMTRMGESFKFKRISEEPK